MTNEEAVQHFRTIRIYSFQDGYTDEAREALEAQPERHTSQ